MRDVLLLAFLGNGLDDCLHILPALFNGGNVAALGGRVHVEQGGTVGNHLHVGTGLEEQAALQAGVDGLDARAHSK